VDRKPFDSLDSLTSLRGIAALVVVGFHADALISGAGMAHIGIGRGYLAVDLFFMLSGFVLAHVYGATIDRPGAVGPFWWARIARVYPTHLAVLLMLLPFFGTRPDFSGTGLALNAILMQVPWLGALSWNQVAWSVSCEAYAYALFPFVARRILAGGAPCWVTAIASAEAVALLIWHEGSGNVAFGFAALFRSFPEFLIGIALYRAYAQGWARDMLRRDRIPLAALGAIAALSFFPMLSDIAIIGLLAPLLIAVAHNSGRVSRFLESAPLRYLGKISYSLYLMQIVPELLLDEHIAGFPALQHAPIIVGIFVGTSFIGAALVSRCIEYPARAALRRRFVPKPTPLPEAAT
jgi:peptidoglycan/LPS O-acetylase OafA/YrhL